MSTTHQGRDPRWWPQALALTVTALLAWWPRATTAVACVATLSVWPAAWLGARSARSRLRAGVVPAAVPLGIALGWWGLDQLARWPAPSTSSWPEIAAAGLDAARLSLLTGGVVTLLVYLAMRVSWARALPGLTTVAAMSLLLRAHRGGAIHLPQSLSDPAWLRGWNPALALAACGGLAGLIAVIALLRPRRSRAVVLQIALVTLVAIAFFLLAPHRGLLSFSSDDPLGLSKPSSDEGRAAAAQRPGDGLRPARAGDKGARPWHELASGDGLPWLDDYSGQEGEARPRPNPAVAAVVLHDDLTPAGGIFYFRQTAFSIFNGAKLVRSSDPRMDTDLIARYPTLAAAAPSGPLLGLDHRRPLPATVALLRELIAPIGIADAEWMRPAENPDPSLFRRVYDVDSQVLTADEELLLQLPLAATDWPETVRRAYLEYPDDPRYDALAAEIVAVLRPEYHDHPLARAIAVRHWLTTNTKYSLRSKHRDAADPAASFLFGNRIGYCVHLAHAAAYLLRALDVPSRVATGYAYQAEDRGSGSSILLRGSEAHAWAEVFLGGVGWLPVDPSPPSIDPPVPIPDADLQRLLGELARPRSQAGAPHEAEAQRLPTPAELLFALLIAGGAACASGHAIKLWRRIAPRLIGDDRRGRRHLTLALDRLADAGLIRAPGETREAFARRVGPISPAFGALTDAHLASTFGSGTVDRGHASRLTRQIGHDLVRHGGWRRRLRLVHPFSWRGTR